MKNRDTKDPREQDAHDRNDAHESPAAALSLGDRLAVLVPIPKDQAATLDSLLELYAHDFSEFMPLELQDNGRFDASPGDIWWTAGHFPFFIRSRGKLVGFALAGRGSHVTDDASVMDVAEFFVIRGARKQGVGAAAAHALFAAFPGKWEVRVRRTNVPARHFWVRAIENIAGSTPASHAFSAKGAEWEVFRLDSSPR